jgi:hypothetical protein
MNTPASDTHDTPFGAPPRPLTEDVLQSAEEAVLANPASVESLQDGEPVPDASRAGVSRTPYADGLARRVAEKPVQSALLALAFGALLTALVKAALIRRR